MFDSRNADCVRPDAVNCFKMLGMHQQPCKFILITLQSKQNTESDVINAAFHCSVHCLGMVIIVVLRSSRMKFKIALFIVCFLKQDVRSDAGILKFPIVFNRGCGNVHVHPANISVFVVNGIDSFYAFEYVLYRVVNRIFACFDRKAFMPHILQSDYFLTHLFLRQFNTGDMFVFEVIRTVYAAVHAVI